MAGQVYEFTAFYSEGLGFTTNLFGSAFYALTGFPRRPRHHRHHHADVTVRDVDAVAISGRSGPETVEIIGLYWHFVDIVWIVIFTIVYLFPQ